MINKDTLTEILMSKFNKILVTGGAGYIGSVLTSNLVQRGYNVRILDKLVYGSDGISNLISDNSIELVSNDIRNADAVEHALQDIDCVIHLAAIVGEPLCKKIPEAAKQINEIATKQLVNICKKKGVQRFIYSSTCSNYGSSSQIVNEDTPLQALSLYSETKVNSESFILNLKDSNFEPCVLRFATAFGLSTRMRFDLLLHEFIRDAIVNKKIVIFGPNYWRPLVHVQDISNACINAIENSSDLISGEVYNVGDTEQNFTKLNLAEIIKKYLPSTQIEIKETKKDPRNYRVSFEKIKNNLDFNITMTVEDGALEIFNEINSGKLNPRESEFSNMAKLTENIEVF